MNFIILTFFLKCALITNHTDLLYNYDYRLHFCDNDYYLSIQTDVEILLFNHIFIGGIINIPVMVYPEKISFHPVNLASTFSMGLRYGIIELGYNHFCVHPVIPLPFLGTGVKYEGVHDEVYIRIGGKI